MDGPNDIRDFLTTRRARLTPQQVRAALQRHLDLHKLSVVKAGDFARVTGKGEPGQSKN